MDTIIRVVITSLCVFFFWKPDASAQSTQSPKLRSGPVETRRAQRVPSTNMKPGETAPSLQLPTEEQATEPVSNKRGSSPDGADTTRDDISSVPLPNTMDGLNDKRPLGVGDRLSFKIVEDETAPRPLIVTDSMEIDLPYIGRVPASNKTCKQFAYYVKKLLEKEYYFQATVLVGLDSAGGGTRAVSRGKIYVMGQVRSQGAMEIPVDETFTVTKAILRAGGFGPYANKRKVKLVRGGKAGASSSPIIIDCAKILDNGEWSRDVEVNPDDIITVPEKLINIF